MGYRQPDTGTSRECALRGPAAGKTKQPAKAWLRAADCILKRHEREGRDPFPGERSGTSKREGKSPPITAEARTSMPIQGSDDLPISARWHVTRINQRALRHLNGQLTPRRLEHRPRGKEGHDREGGPESAATTPPAPPKPTTPAGGKKRTPTRAASSTNT